MQNAINIKKKPYVHYIWLSEIHLHICYNFQKRRHKLRYCNTGYCIGTDMIAHILHGYILQLQTFKISFIFSQIYIKQLMKSLCYKHTVISMIYMFQSLLNWAIFTIFLRYKFKLFKPNSFIGTKSKIKWLTKKWINSWIYTKIAQISWL